LPGPPCENRSFPTCFQYLPLYLSASGAYLPFPPTWPRKDNKGRWYYTGIPLTLLFSDLPPCPPEPSEPDSSLPLPLQRGREETIFPAAAARGFPALSPEALLPAPGAGSGRSGNHTPALQGGRPDKS